MAKKNSKTDHRFQPRRPVVVVCRGGDCGSQRKHRELDHVAQLARFRNEIDASAASVTVSKCLDACDFSNVVVVVPGAEGRHEGLESTWVGGVLDDATTDDVIAWVNADDPEGAPPALVQIQRFHPTRQSRRELNEPGTLPGHRS